TITVELQAYGLPLLKSKQFCREEHNRMSRGGAHPEVGEHCIRLPFAQVLPSSIFCEPPKISPRGGRQSRARCCWPAGNRFDVMRQTVISVCGTRARTGKPRCRSNSATVQPTPPDRPAAPVTRTGPLIDIISPLGRADIMILPHD